MTDLSVCITSFKRPQFLDRCLDSVRKAGIVNVVIATSEPTPEVLAVIEKHSAGWNSYRVSIVEQNIGCSRTWMLAVYHSTTERVIVLHDDDVILPGLGTAYVEKLKPALDSGIGIASWRANECFEDGRVGGYEYFNQHGRIPPTGPYHISTLETILMKRGWASMSPIVTILNRSITLRALKEEQTALTGPRYVLRPGMTLGTELLVYLRHCVASKQWFFLAELLSYYGHHAGSGTVAALRAGKTKTITDGYDAARAYFKLHRAPPTRYAPKLIFIYSDYAASNTDEQRRFDHAKFTWMHQFNQGVMLEFRTANADIPSAPVPLLHAVIDYGLKFALSEDIIVYCNRDVGLTTGAAERIKAAVLKYGGCCYCMRRQFTPKPGLLYNSVIAHGKQDGGIDLIAVTPKWWTANKDKIPPFLIGRELWDLATKAVMDESCKRSANCDDAIYHEPHAPHWKTVMDTDAGQLHNRRLGRDFFRARGRSDIVAAVSTENPVIYVYAICYHEMPMIDFFLRHYSQFADKIIIYDEQSTDGTREVIAACPKAELREWPHKGLDDDKFIGAVNSVYREARGKADWVMWPDIDEMLYHPNLVETLRTTNGAIIPTRAYALISTNGDPKTEDQRQIYEQVRTGIRQPNYDKDIIWRPSIDITFEVGRHFNKHHSQLASTPFKLFHCHYIYGAESTKARNARNYDRVIVNKKYAWNVAPEFNKPEQSGTEEWVKRLIETRALVDVLDDPVTPVVVTKPAPVLAQRLRPNYIGFRR